MAGIFMCKLNSIVVTLLSTALAASLALAQPTASPSGASGAAPKKDSARPALKRPPLEGSSFDVGRYDIKEVDGKSSSNFLGATTEIEAKVGESFGFTWSLQGFTGTRLVPIRTVVKHPAFTLKGEQAPRTMFEEKVFFKPINGTTNWPFLYRFDHKEELVPGDWTLSVYYDTQLVAEHTFKVIAAK
jgi:hypothetical protein